MAAMASWFPERYGRVRMLLAELRQQAQMSQAQVAQQLGVPQQHVSRVETGDRRIDPAELEAFARLFGVPVSIFFEDDKTASPDA